MSVAARLLGMAAAVALFLIPAPGSTQELEPGAYWPIPTGFNIVTVVNSLNWGDVAFEPAAPIDEARATINTTAFTFTRAFSLGGRSANATVIVPIVGGHLEGLYLGEPAETGRFGLGDPRLRLGVNLYGAPAMTPKEYASSYRQRTLVGVSITAAPPLGQYDPAKLINLGTNRWSFKPDVGVSHTRGQWVVEMMAGVWVFTDNDNFAGGSTRTQDPIAQVQFHLTYRFTAACGWRRTPTTTRAGRRRSGPAEPRPAAQFTDRRDVFAGARSAAGDSGLREPRRIHHDRRRLQLDRGRLQLRLGALARFQIVRQCPPSGGPREVRLKPDTTYYTEVERQPAQFPVTARVTSHEPRKRGVILL